jgi:hypothetical protein
LFENWIKDSSGNPILQPVVGYDSAVASNKSVALRFEYGNSGGDQPPSTIQLFLTSSQVAHLAQTLFTAIGNVNYRHNLM